MPTVRGWAALGVAAALTVLWIAFGEIELLGTAVFLVAAIVLAIIRVRTNPPRARVRRRIFPNRVHEGDRVVVEAELSTARPIGNLTLEDRVRGLGVARFAAARSGTNLPLLARYEVSCRSRGIFEVGPASVTVGDPLGLAELTTPAGSSGRLVVFPRVEDLLGFPAVRGHDGSVQTTRPTGSPHGGEDFFTLREYQVGDDLRRVHWPSSAKRDRLMIKQLEIPWQSRALVLFDQRGVRYPTTDAFEHGVRAAASAVRHLYAGGYSPDLWAGEQATGLTSGNRFTHAMELLAGIEPASALDLQAAVTRLRRSGVGGGALVIATGVPDEAVLAAFRALAPDFTRTIVMAVTVAEGDGLAALRNAGAVTVTAGPAARWAPAWRTAMELSWSIASAG